MNTETTDSGPSSNDLLRRSRNGDEASWGKLLTSHQSRLTRMIRLRMDPRLRGRVDEGDIIQESFLEASKRRPEFFAQPDMPFFVWLRLISLQKLAQFHRHHLAVQARDARRDVSIYASLPAATSTVLAAQLLGQETSPSQNMARLELQERMNAALNSLEVMDREIIALRNFEQLSNVEAAAILSVSTSAASSRYIRALRKLKKAVGPELTF